MNAALCFDNFLVLDNFFYSRPGQKIGQGSEEVVF